MTIGLNWVDRFLLPFMPKRRPKNTEGPRYADIYVRAVAACIDISILFVILNNAFGIITNATYQSIDHALFQQAMSSTSPAEVAHLLIQSNALNMMLINGIIQIAIIGIILVSVQWLWGITPGKWLMDLRIRRVDTLEPITRWQMALRFMAYVPACAPLMLGIIWASFNKRRRGWHDYMAGTVVIYNHPEGWYWQQVKRGFRWVKNRIEQHRK